MESVVASAAAVVEKCAGRTERPRASSLAGPSVQEFWNTREPFQSVHHSASEIGAKGRLLEQQIYAINYWRLTYPTTRRWVSQALPSPRPPMPPPARAKRPSVASPHPTRCRPRRPRNALKSRSGRAGLRSPPPRPAGPPARRVPFQFQPGKRWNELDAAVYAPAGTRQRPWQPERCFSLRTTSRRSRTRRYRPGPRPADGMPHPPLRR